MQFGEAISDGFSKYAQFSGRSSRSAFWYWVLFYVLIIIAASIIDAIITVPVVTSLVWLGTIIPYLAVLARRLHDTDKSAWWILIGLIPLIGGIVLIVFACIDSGPPNQYGEGPDGKPSTMSSMQYGQMTPPPPPMPQSPPSNMPPPSEMPPPDQGERRDG